MVVKSFPVHVIGLGRVGLITLFHLARKGFHPVGVDIDKELIEKLKKGKIPFFEADFNNILKKYKSRISFQTAFCQVGLNFSPTFRSAPNRLQPRNKGLSRKQTEKRKQVNKRGKYWFICVPTPFDKLHKKMNLSNLETLLEQIDSVSGKNFVFIRSTLIPGSLREFAKKFQNCAFAYFPEFFREGCFFNDYQRRQFSILGLRDKDIFNHWSQFEFSKTTELCSPEEAELVKIISNLFHGLKVSFANEAGRMSKLFEADPDRVMELFLKDRELNVSEKYFNPGFAYGGPCLGKDIQSLASLSVNCSNLLPQYVEKSNTMHIQWVAKQILSLKPKKISLLGAYFKGDKTADYRDSAVLALAQILSKKAKVFGVEAELADHGVHVFPSKLMDKLLLSDVFVLGAVSLFAVKKDLFKTYKGRIFDLLIERLPKEIRNHKNYTTAYT